MPMAFPGFSPKALSFFRQLEKNNRREWFQPRKEQFDELLYKPMLELATVIAGDLRTFAVDNVCVPKKAIYRIYRDTRFSKDKTPYKTHIAATFPRAGLPRHSGAGFYYSVSHTGVEVAAGSYMPGPDELTAIRTAIAKDEKRFRKLIDDKRTRKLLGEIQGEQLSRVPRGFPADSTAADLLRRKQFYFYTTLEADIALTPGIRKAVVDRFRALAPFVEWINATLLSVLRSDADEAIPKRPEAMF
jgi:uncharacterized protein (TIGR02453 family)